MRLHRTVSRFLTAAGATALLTLGLGAAPAPAQAAESVAAPAPVLPYCVQVSDSAGRLAQYCVNSAKAVAMPGYVGETVQLDSYLKYCTGTYSCSTTNLDILATGAGVNVNDLVPALVYNGSTTVTLTRVCTGSTCTPGSVSVPAYDVYLFPDADPLVRICVNGTCSSTPVATIDVTDAVYDTVATFSVQ